MGMEPRFMDSDGVSASKGDYSIVTSKAVDSS